jgi:hypothetical protein
MGSSESSAVSARPRGRFRAARAAGISTLVLAMAWTGAALADPTAADRETARSLMQEARDLRDKGHMGDALKRFKAADDIMHVPTTGLEVAKTQAAMSMLVEARDTIAGIRKLPSSPSDPAPFQDARTKADELDTALESRIPALNITVTGGAEGETPTIVVDGIPVPAAASGLPRKVDPGRHTVVAKGASGRGDQTVDIKEGEQKDVQIALTAGGGDTGDSNDGQAAHPDQPADNGPPKSHSPTLVTWIGAGVGAAGLLVGSITGIMSISTTGKLKDECKTSVCTSGSPGGNDYASASSLATVSDVMFAVAGAGAAVAVLSLVLGHAESDTPAKAPDSAAPSGGDGTDAPTDPSAAPAAPQSRLEVHPWIGLGSAGVTGVF